METDNDFDTDQPFMQQIKKGRKLRLARNFSGPYILIIGGPQGILDGIGRR